MARSLRARLALWYAAVLSAALLAFGAAVLILVHLDEASESPAVKALEGPDLLEGRLWIAVAIALPGALLFAVGGGWWITRRALAPLETIVDFTRGLGADELERRVALEPKAATEIVALSTALNQMLEKLERAVAGMRRFTADASHELRTPIAIVKGELELLQRNPDPEKLGSALEELQRVERLIESLLTLARSDNGELPLQRVDVELAPLVRSVLAPYEPLFAARGVNLEFSDGTGARASADPLWLGRAVANLVDNACKLTPPGGRVRVAVAREENFSVVRVADSGPGLSDEDRARLFERFHRGSAGRAAGAPEGFGLGLALAREIARALGGELIAAPAPSNGGAEFQLRLPTV